MQDDIPASRHASLLYGYTRSIHALYKDCIQGWPWSRHYLHWFYQSVHDTGMDWHLLDGAVVVIVLLVKATLGELHLIQRKPT